MRSMASNTVQNNKLQLLGKLTASLIHEIRNPLSAIKLNLDLINMSKDDLPEEVLDSVDDCMKATARIEYMVDNLLSFARKNADCDDTFHINEITRNAIELVTVKATRKKINIISSLDVSDPIVNIDENRLLQVILNLITNAIEACDENGVIKITTSKAKTDSSVYVKWVIEDDGEGIDEESQSKIFNDFYTSKKEGTGLGLSVCKMILGQYGAELDFTSEKGVGTTFMITFDVTKLER